MTRLIAFLFLILAPGIASAEVHRASVAVTAALPKADAWTLLRDFSLAHNYVPGITRTEIVSDSGQGVGAHRRVYDEEGDFLEETIIEWRDGAGFVIRLHDGDAPMAPFQRAEFVYALAEADAATTRIELALIFEMPWGWLGDTLAEWIIVPLMEDNLVQVAAGMKVFYETGLAATDEDRQREAAAVQVLPAAIVD
ncbi:MAG: SRPBCC family protein [Halieaceae bacterium]